MPTEQRTVELLERILEKLSRTSTGYSGLPRDGSFTSNADKPSRDNLADPVKLNREMREYNESLKNMNKGIAAFIPLYGKLTGKIKHTTETLERSIRGTSEAYKESAKSAYDYTKTIRNNVDELEKVSEAYREIHKEATKVQESQKKLAEVNKKIKELIERDKAHGRTDESRKEREELLREQRSLLKYLNEQSETRILKLIDKVSDPEQKQALLDIVENIKEGNKSITTLIDSSAGTLTGMSSLIKDVGDNINRMRMDMTSAVSRGVRAIVAGLMEVPRRELANVMERQRRIGRQSGFRWTSALMGMSESEGMRLMDENRHLLRRMSRTGIDLSRESEIDFFRSSQFREMQQMAHAMGLRGEDATRQILELAEIRRLSGLQSDTGTMSRTVDFLREGRLRYGLTQEEMTRFYSDIHQAALIAGRGADDIEDAIEEEMDARARLARLLNQDVEHQTRRLRELNRLQFGDPAAALRQGIVLSIMGQSTGAIDSEEGNILRRFTMGDDSLTEEERQRGMLLTERARRGTGRQMFEGGFGDRLVLSTMAGQAGGIDANELVEEYIRSRGLTDDQLSMEGFEWLGREQAAMSEGAGDLNSTMKLLIRTLELLDGSVKSTLGGAFLAAGTLISQAVTMLINYMVFSRMGGFGGLGRVGRGGLGRFAGAFGRAGRFLGPVGAVATLGYGGYQSISLSKDIKELEKLQASGLGRSEITEAISGLQTDRGKTIGMAIGTTLGAALGAVFGGWGAIPGAVVGGYVGDKTGELFTRDRRTEWEKEWERIEYDIIRTDLRDHGQYGQYMTSLDRDKRRVEELNRMIALSRTDKEREELRERRDYLEHTKIPAIEERMKSVELEERGRIREGDTRYTMLQELSGLSATRIKVEDSFWGPQFTPRMEADEESLQRFKEIIDDIRESVEEGNIADYTDAQLRQIIKDIKRLDTDNTYEELLGEIAKHIEGTERNTSETLEEQRQSNRMAKYAQLMEIRERDKKFILGDVLTTIDRFDKMRTDTYDQVMEHVQ